MQAIEQEIELWMVPLAKGGWPHRLTQDIEAAFSKRKEAFARAQHKLALLEATLHDQRDQTPLQHESDTNPHSNTTSTNPYWEQARRPSPLRVPYTNIAMNHTPYAPPNTDLVVVLQSTHTLVLMIEKDWTATTRPRPLMNDSGKSIVMSNLVNLVPRFLIFGDA